MIASNSTLSVQGTDGEWIPLGEACELFAATPVLDTPGLTSAMPANEECSVTLHFTVECKSDRKRFRRFMDSFRPPWIINRARRGHQVNKRSFSVTKKRGANPCPWPSRWPSRR